MTAIEEPPDIAREFVAGGVEVAMTPQPPNSVALVATASVAHDPPKAPDSLLEPHPVDAPHSKEAPPALPLCWGHRGASADYPENTLASFEAAILAGADGIESDVHVSRDRVIVMFHDPNLGRTTNGTGTIKTQDYVGGLDQLKTLKFPQQKIPTFKETVNLLLQPANLHVMLNIDVKVDNDPTLLFSLMHETISSHPNYETVLAPRLVIGLWHPKFIKAAQKHLPYARLTHIGVSPSIARKFFWDSCQSFSILFGPLVSADGENFRRECQAAGKDFFVWTVNRRSEMIEATKWGAKAILTDRPAEFLKLRADMEEDWKSVAAETGWTFGWSSLLYTSFANFLLTNLAWSLLAKRGGAFELEIP